MWRMINSSNIVDNRLIDTFKISQASKKGYRVVKLEADELDKEESNTQKARRNLLQRHLTITKNVSIKTPMSELSCSISGQSFADPFGDDS